MTNTLNNVAKNLSTYLKNLKRKFPENSNLEILANRFKTQSFSTRKDIGTYIAYQGVEDPFFLALFGAIIQDLSKCSSLKSQIIFTRSLEGSIGFGVKNSILRSQLYAWPLTSQWVNLYKIFVDKVGYRTQNFYHPISDLWNLIYSFILWRGLLRKGQVSDFKIDNILIGDLLIDTYLRFRPSSIFNISDKFNWIILWQALRDIKRAKKYFSKERPRAYLSTYSTYIQHGIPVRIALMCDIPVFTFGSYNVFGKQLTNEDFYQTPDTSGYRKTFESLSNKDELIAQADSQIKKRFSGKNDFATAYMSKSAYSSTVLDIPDIKGHVAVFLHNFYDSPHVYPDLIFDDFWEWVTFTIEHLIKNKIPFFLKPHPNQIEISGDVVRRLSAIYSDVKIISPEISNAQLIEGGIIAGITVYGTIAHELAYFGIPSIACARHPHHSFEFCRTAKSKDQYAEFLLNPNYLPLLPQDMKREALSFFYMHNIFGGVDEADLRIAFSGISQLSKDGLEKNIDQFSCELNIMRGLIGYKYFLNKLVKLSQ